MKKISFFKFRGVIITDLDVGGTNYKNLKRLFMKFRGSIKSRFES